MTLAKFKIDLNIEKGKPWILQLRKPGKGKGKLGSEREQKKISKYLRKEHNLLEKKYQRWRGSWEVENMPVSIYESYVKDLKRHYLDTVKLLGEFRTEIINNRFTKVDEHFYKGHTTTAMGLLESIIMDIHEKIRKHYLEIN